MVADHPKLDLDAELRRKIAEVAQSDVPITWEMLESVDLRLFCFFNELPRREDLLALLEEGS
jgi:hypothetical protein